jgi:peptide/nickel transport system permease protein
MTVVAAPSETTAQRAIGGRAAPESSGGAWPALLRHPLGLAAAVFLAVIVVISAAAPLVARVDPNALDLANTMARPSGAHWLGTDQLGRDVLSRLIYGGRATLLGVVEADAVFLVVGVALGLIAGFLGGWPDRLISRFADLVLSLPAIIVLLMILAVFPGNDVAGMTAFGLIGSPGMLRIVRGGTISLRNELYVKAARLSGLRTPQLLIRHILPRLRGPIIVQASLFSASAVLVQASLSFLGLMAPDTQGPSWGNMIAEASNVISEDPWLLVPAGGVLALTVLSLGLLGDAVRDITVGRSLGREAGRPPTRRRRAARGTSSAAPTVMATQGSEPLLSVRELSIAFTSGQREVTVVRSVSFDIAPGEALGLVGESGSGKTVVARSLLGLLPGSGRVIGGSIGFQGREITTLGERGMAKIRGTQIALISQEPMAGLDPSFKVGSQLIEVIRRHRHLARRMAWPRALELLELVELEEPESVANRYPHQLSGGMAQRVSIALALAAEPTLLIADEPTTALDVTVQAEILALLRHLQERLGMAVLVITHDWGVLVDVCDRALVMYAGELVESATVDDLYSAPRHPYTQGLLAANPHLAAVGESLPAIPGHVPPPTSWPAGCHFQPRCHYATAECGAGIIPVTAPAPGRLTRCIHSHELVA